MRYEAAGMVEILLMAIQCDRMVNTITSRQCFRQIRQGKEERRNVGKQGNKGWSTDGQTIKTETSILVPGTRAMRIWSRKE